MERDRLQRLVRSGLASSEEVAALQTAKSEFATAEEAREAHLEDVFAAAVEGCATAVVTRLENMHANKSWSLPPQYGAVTRTQQEWVDLRDTLANEKISAKYEEDPDPESQSLLTTCNTDAEVAAAKVSLDTNCSSVEAAWCQALATD